jgi:hypothetical protein
MPVWPQAAIGSRLPTVHRAPLPARPSGRRRNVCRQTPAVLSFRLRTIARRRQRGGLRSRTIARRRRGAIPCLRPRTIPGRRPRTIPRREGRAGLSHRPRTIRRRRGRAGLSRRPPTIPRREGRAGLSRRPPTIPRRRGRAGLSRRPPTIPRRREVRRRAALPRGGRRLRGTQRAQPVFGRVTVRDSPAWDSTSATRASPGSLRLHLAAALPSGQAHAERDEERDSQSRPDDRDELARVPGPVPTVRRVQPAGHRRRPS